MISKKDIIKMAKKVTHRSRGYTERKVINPHREWFIGVLMFIVVAVVGGVFNARNHVYYSTLESTVTDTTTPIKKYRKQTTEDANEIYSARLDSFDRLVNDVPVVFDVSTTTASSSDEIIEDEEDLDSDEFIEEDIAVEDESIEVSDVEEVVDEPLAE